MKKKWLFTLSASALAFVFALSACTVLPDTGGPDGGPDDDDPVIENPVDDPTKDPTDDPTENPDTPPEDEVVEFVPISGSYEGTVGEVAFKLPDLGTKVNLHTEAQAGFMKAKGYGTAIFEYAQGLEEISHPVPVTFTWEAEGAAKNSVYTLSISESEDMADPWTYTTTELSLEVYNLKIATTYWWTVAAGEDVSGAAYFSTDTLGPRNLYVDGVANVRDIGGWQLSNGSRIKQGLLFRTGRLNEDYSGVRSITEAGMDTMLNFLNVKTELDLRGGKNDPSEFAPTVNKSALGNTVSYYHVGMRWDGDLLNLNHAEICEVFSLLADESNYPMIYHCSIGTDRTGLITYLLLGLLGAPEEAIYRDYLFSNFANIGGQRDLGNITSKYGATIKNKYTGKNLSEKVRAALIEIGVEPTELDSIVNIFTA